MIVWMLHEQRTDLTPNGAKGASHTIKTMEISKIKGKCVENVALRNLSWLADVSSRPATIFLGDIFALINKRWSPCVVVTFKRMDDPSNIQHPVAWLPIMMIIGWFGNNIGNFVKAI